MKLMKIFSIIGFLLSTAVHLYACGKRDGKNPVSRFEKAVSQLGDLISSTCATILTSGADMNEEELVALYPAIGQAFVACCELFPEDPEEEGYLYEWEFPNGYGEEDGEYALFFQAADG